MQRDKVRLIGMVGMLIVLGMLIYRTSDPNTWQWLVRNSSPPAPLAAAPQPIVASEPEPAPDGPTDLDPEERDAIKETFQAVSDGTLEIQREEMPSYHRLLDWTANQSATAMVRRANAQLRFGQFMERPEEHRGQLVALDLHIARILSYEDRGQTLYEVWGWTNETKGWLYVAVVPDLPPGMTVGAEVHERATLVGYFFKLQGYHEAGAKPHAPPLQAPLLVGRLLPPQPMSGPATTSVPTWPWWVMVLIAILVGIFLLVQITLPILRIRRQRRLQSTVGTMPGAATPVWPLEMPDEEALETASDDQFPRVS